MAGLFSRTAFVHFGPTALDPASPLPPVVQIHGPSAARLRKQVREECPRKSGVYGMVDGHGGLIYVGKAKVLRARLLTYFRPRSRDPKAGRVLARTAAIVWEVCPSEFAALHRELELIRRWRPRFNVQGQPTGRRRTYVCLGRKPAPYAFLAGQPPANALAGFGPIPAGKRAQEAVRRLNDWFQLRNCSQAQEMVFADQAELFPLVRSPGCLRHEIGTCLGPCVAACSRQDYSERVKAARAFLAGTQTGLLKTLQRDMVAASGAMAFERAAALRDKLEVLTWLREQLDRLEHARKEFSFVYPITGEEGRVLWYLIHGGRTVAVVLPPGDSPFGASAEAVLRAVFRKKQAGPVTVEEMDGLYLVASWFRRHPEERARVLEPEQALRLCRGI